MLCECCYRQSVAVAGWIVWGTIDPSVTKLPWHFPGCAVSTTQPPASPAPCLSQHVLMITTFLLPTKCRSYRALCCARAGRIRFFFHLMLTHFSLIYLCIYPTQSRGVCVETNASTRANTHHSLTTALTTIVCDSFILYSLNSPWDLFYWCLFCKFETSDRSSVLSVCWIVRLTHLKLSWPGAGVCTDN